MKKLIIVLFLVVLVTGCNEEKYPDEYTNNLPFGLKYCISELEANHITDSLEQANILVRPYPGSSSYEYNLSLPDGSSIELSIEPRFCNDSLYYIDIREGFGRSDKSEKENYKIAIEFFKAQEINLNTYTKAHDKVWHEYIWSKPAQRICLYYDNNLVIIFEDKLISGRLDMENSKKNAEETRKRLEKKESGINVENSVWDGSVRQVEKYLKSNLKDASSYESIEWSEVKETETGYVVRHKYRAKNSFGAYVIENNIFHLDHKGNIINVTPL